MTDWKQFEQDLYEALPHLYDPGFEPSEGLRLFLGGDPLAGAAAVQSAVLRGIESLAPRPDAPLGARTRQVYDVLYSRFVLKLTQEGAAERLHMSVSTVKRAQREAIHVLARLLWERASEGSRASGDPLPRGPSRAPPPVADLQAADWQTQARRELASLQASAPGAVADVGDAVRSVLDLGTALMPPGSPQARVGFIQRNLVAAVHPALLQQMLIGALRLLANHRRGREIVVFGGLGDGRVRISLVSPLSPGEKPTTEALRLGEILAPQGGSVRAGLDGDRLAIWLELPSIGRTTVLVVDDNDDMARFYRRATAGTRYHIVHVARGEDVDQAIASAAPHVVVLDVMLPDVDGWRLLMRLRADPATDAIPVIVASVVREETLARSLGAAAYLSKPVRPRQFIRTLDEVLSAGSAASDQNDGQPA